MRRDGHWYLWRTAARTRLGRLRARWRTRNARPVATLEPADLLGSDELVLRSVLAEETLVPLPPLRARPPVPGSTTWGRERTTPRREVLIVRDGQVFGGTGWVGVHGAVFGSLGNAYYGANAATDRRLGSLTPGTTLPGRSATLTQQGFQNYFHWTMQGLPRLADLLATIGGVTSIDRFLHTEPLPPHMLESLERLGVPASRLHRIDDQIVSCEELVCTTMVRDDQSIPLAHIDLVRELYADALAPAADDIVYVSRRPAARRHLLNEDDVRAAVAEVGGRTVDAAAIPVAEQARLYSGIRVLIAVHGAELANVPFMRPTSAVLEIFPANLFPPVYSRLCRSRGMAYDCVTGTEPRLPRRIGGGLHAADVRVDIVELRRHLSALL